MNVFPIMTHVKVDGLPFSSLTEMCYYCTKSVSSYVWIYFCMWEESHWVLLRYLNSVYKIFIYECKAFNIDINGNSAWDLVVKINHMLIAYYEQAIWGNCLFPWLELNILLSKQLNMCNAWLRVCWQSYFHFS